MMPFNTDKSVQGTEDGDKTVKGTEDGDKTVDAMEKKQFAKPIPVGMSLKGNQKFQCGDSQLTTKTDLKDVLGDDSEQKTPTTFKIFDKNCHPYTDNDRNSDTSYDILGSEVSDECGETISINHLDVLPQICTKKIQFNESVSVAKYEDLSEEIVPLGTECDRGPIPFTKKPLLKRIRRFFRFQLYRFVFCCCPSLMYEDTDDLDEI